MTILGLFCAVHVECAIAGEGDAPSIMFPGPDVSESIVDGSGGALIGMTVPARKAVLAAVMPARIARLAADEGDRVEQGEMVVELDSSIQRARVAIARASAETSITVDLAKTEWERVQRELERLERLRDDSSASGKELEDARSLARVRRLEYELAVFNQEQAVRAYERERALLEEHHLVAPFSGYIVEHLKHAGETVDALEGIAALVQLDPLWVTVDCPLSLAGTIVEGAPAVVSPIGIDRSRRMARVIHVSPVADTGSQTFRVRLEVENADRGWLAGMKVSVSFAASERARALLTTHPVQDRSREEPTPVGLPSSDQ